MTQTFRACFGLTLSYVTQFRVDGKESQVVQIFLEENTAVMYRTLFFLFFLMKRGKKCYVTSGIRHFGLESITN